MLFKERIKAEPKYIGQGHRLGFCADTGLIKRKVDGGKEKECGRLREGGGER